MKLGTFRGAAVAVAASMVTALAAAQTGAPQSGLNIPDNIRFVGRGDPNVRRATAIVNGEVITGTDIDHRLALILVANEGQPSPEEMEMVRAQVLRNLIDESLQIQAAAQHDINVQQREIDQYYGRFAQRFNHNAQSFTEYLRSIGSSEASIKRQIRAEVAWGRLLGRRIQPFVSVSEDEVQQILDRMHASRGTAEYRVAEIFISATPETAAEVAANAARIAQQIRAGAPFAAYARQFSEASTAAVGGELGWVRPEQLPAELASIVPQLPIGAISDPIPVSGGFSIVALADARQLFTADPRDAMLSLMQMSIMMPSGTTEMQANARATELARAAQAMGGCGRAAETARTLGAELVTSDQMRLRDLPPPVQQMLINLNVGQATAPFGSIERVSVLILCGRDDPQTAEAPSFDDLYEQITEDRVNRRAQRYLRDLRRDAVIQYN